MKYYTLYYQPMTSSDHVIAVATSNSLLKLIKIEYMTFHNRKGFPYIIRTEDFSYKDAFKYGAGCLFVPELDDFNRFVANVDAGKDYKTYNYSQRVRELLNRRV